MTNYDRAALAFEDPGAGYPRCTKCRHEADDHKNLVGPDGKACWIDRCDCDGYTQEREDAGEERARARGLI